MDSHSFLIMKSGDTMTQILISCTQSQCFQISMLILQVLLLAQPISM